MAEERSKVRVEERLKIKIGELRKHKCICFTKFQCRIVLYIGEQSVIRF